MHSNNHQRPNNRLGEIQMQEAIQIVARWRQCRCQFFIVMDIRKLQIWARAIKRLGANCIDARAKKYMDTFIPGWIEIVLLITTDRTDCRL